jgi:HD-like signal output (HDOD) protein
METAKDRAMGTRLHGIIVRQPGKAQAALARFVTMLLNYEYGVHVVETADFEQTHSVVEENDKNICCCFVISAAAAPSTPLVSSLNPQGKYPLFFLIPATRVKEYNSTRKGLRNTIVCPWEKASYNGGSALQRSIEGALEAIGVRRLIDPMSETPAEDLPALVVRQLEGISTLPSMPSIAMRIMKMVSDPETTMEEVEKVILTDLTIVQKLMQVVNSPVFAGAAHKGRWTIKDALTRLGLKKVGAIAVQIKLINSFLRPEESLFDIERFWAHSVGCAWVADRLYTNGVLGSDTIGFDDYWIGGLLHDIGKLLLGLYFWDHFEAILNEMVRKGVSFRTVEGQFGSVPNHEYIGQILLLKSNMGPDMVNWVKNHDSIEAAPDALTCLLHLSNTICKQLGLCYPPEENVEYNPSVLKRMKLIP